MAQLKLQAVGASSVCSKLNGPEHVVTDYEYRFQHYWLSRAPSGKEWLVFDAGEPVDVSHVDLRHMDRDPDYQPKQCALFASPWSDGPWGSALSFSMSRTEDWQRFEGASGIGRYWKLCLLNKHGDAQNKYGMALDGVKLFGSKAPVQLLTLHPMPSDDGASLDVLVTSMAGDEMAQVQVRTSKALPDVFAVITAELGPGYRQYMLADGRIVLSEDPRQTIGSFLGISAAVEEMPQLDPGQTIGSSLGISATVEEMPQLDIAGGVELAHNTAKSAVPQEKNTAKNHAKKERKKRATAKRKAAAAADAANGRSSHQRLAQ